ncbi:TlpA disulfide reductase family protein [Rhodohalobacter sp.]|uniref:TlpA disulfide reductase family protein n=1 Tax=Rhodohalobacter sp. TaxID=1974210 RepID=UPI002ACE4F3E|nr:TlpA disulfide reductase family protein [Rhodohalobacter sp.]MDZ7757111.1 TlpA disulfide reductase family protein [Rhodohalobacter sp.]MDZ7808251.1 TlpA disulfide reductase family protein [Gracilimonas sp.]
MNRTLLIIALVLFAGFSFFSYSVKDSVLTGTSLSFDEGEEVGSFALPDMSDVQIELSDIIKDNRYTWINFWASWCGPCREEMPMMSELYNEFAEQGLAIVAVNVNENKETIQNYLDQYPVPFTVLRDSSGEITQSYNVEALPTSLLVDSTGAVQRITVGFSRAWEYQIPNLFSNDE